MADEKRYIVENVQDVSYLDDAGEIVEGKRVRYRITELNEIHHLNVPSMVPEIVQERIEAEVEDRFALDGLG